MDIKTLSPDTPVLTDTDEWNAWKGRGDPVLHIDLTKWADVFVIAPLDANSLAKIAQVCQCHGMDHNVSWLLIMIQSVVNVVK